MSFNIAQLRAKMPSKKLSVNMKANSKIAEIIVYGDIGASWFGDSISAKSFSDELAALPKDTEEIHVRINSGGGDVFDGLTIYNRLKQHKAKVTVYIDGLAASIASIIALAGDSVIMGEGAMFMIHKPWTIAYGNSNDFDETSRRLLEVEDQLVNIYLRRSSLTREEVKSMLKAETWMDAQEAKKHGFVDELQEDEFPIAASTLDKVWIAKAPKRLASSLEGDVRKEADALQAKIDKILKGSGK